MKTLQILYMMEQCSKLSIRSKSTTTSQSMDWIIPQSSSEFPYPYFTTEFSIQHPNLMLEMKWRLELEGKQDKIFVNILNVNEKSVFNNKELMNVEVRWNFILKSGHNYDPMVLLSEQMFKQKESMEVNNFQFFKDSQSDGRVVCDLERFESFAIDGRFVVQVRIELEYFEHDEQEMSSNLSKRLSASLSESSIYSKIDFSQKRNFVSSTIDRSKSGSYQIPYHPFNLESSQQPVHYHYHKTSSDSLRRSQSGRFPSNLSTISGASSSSISTIEQVSRARCLSGHLDETQTSEDFDFDHQTYSYIPDHVFLAPVIPPSTSSVQYSNLGDRVFHPTTPTLPTSEEVYHQVPASIPTSSYQPPLTEVSQCQSFPHQLPDLQAQFYSSNNSDSSLSVSNCSFSSASSSMISCIYSGRLPDQAVLLRDRRKLLEMGVKYSLPKLVKECEKSYCQTLQVSNCLETLLVVDNFLPNSEARKIVINFMKVNLKEVMMEANWDKFVVNCDDLVQEICYLQPEGTQ